MTLRAAEPAGRPWERGRTGRRCGKRRSWSRRPWVFLQLGEHPEIGLARIDRVQDDPFQPGQVPDGGQLLVLGDGVAQAHVTVQDLEVTLGIKGNARKVAVHGFVADAAHLLDKVLLVGSHVDPHHPGRKSGELCPQGQSGQGPARARGRDDGQGFLGAAWKLFQVVGQFLHGTDVAEGPQGRGSALGHRKGLFTLAGQIFDHPVHERNPVLVLLRGDPDDLGPHHPVQKDVAGQGRRVLGVVGAQHQPGGQAQPGGGRGCGPGVVGLGPAAGDDQVAAIIPCFGQEELQLADLVARNLGAGQIVPLDMDFRSQPVPQTPQPLERGGGVGQGDAVGVGNPVHLVIPPVEGTARISQPCSTVKKGRRFTRIRP